MKTVFKFIFVAALLAFGAGVWYLAGKQVVRQGTLDLRGLQQEVSVRYDERGVPHINAQNETDMYRALGYVHAQDRLFQMEMVRRLAQGELAEILGPKLLDTDRLFRTLGIREHSARVAQSMDMANPANQALMAYLDGINQYQAGHKAPVEFDILGIPKRPFTPQDTLAVSGYLAYSFAAAFKTEPVMTLVRDQLGPNYLRIFDLDWHPAGVTERNAGALPPMGTALRPADWQGLGQLAALSQSALDQAGVAGFEGSNAWVIDGKHTASGKPLLAGDPHIGFSAPSVWYEAHLSSPGFELYGHYQALNPVALLGHNQQFGWSLTMFQNDDIDLVAEKVNPVNPQEVWHQGKWVTLTERTETIAVKGKAPVELVLRRSPHGPLINSAYPETLGTTPVALWWAFLETENPLLDAFYELNRANTRDKARAAASKIHAPGLNVVWANAEGDIAWWAAAKLPIRPKGVNPTFILDAAKGEADKLGFYPFKDNPQEENPARGSIVSANHQPKGAIAIAGYYNPSARARRLTQALQEPGIAWDSASAQALQLDTQTDYASSFIAALLPIMDPLVSDPQERTLLDALRRWDGKYALDSMAPTLFSQMLFELARAAMVDELGPVQFKAMLRTRTLDEALVRLLADANSPWWDVRGTPAVETRADTVKAAWMASLVHLKNTYGPDTQQWIWGKTHTLTHNHPLGQQKPLDKMFSVGPLPVPGGREVPNNMSGTIGPAPWAVAYGPSTRRVIDFANPSRAVGINPVGQSGVLFDGHYADQARAFARGEYVRQHLSEVDVAGHTRSTLLLRAVP
jgi:penicillin amidase